MRIIIVTVVISLLSNFCLAQRIEHTKPFSGKKNTVQCGHQGGKRIDNKLPTEGDGTGKTVDGKESKRVKNAYMDFIKRRGKFATRKYHLKSPGPDGKPVRFNYKMEKGRILLSSQQIIDQTSPQG